MVIRAAVLGHPVAQSLSPRIYSAWFDEAGIEAQYQALDVSPAAFGSTVRRLAAEGYRGVNVTLPHKIAALALADEATETASGVGASNLLIFNDGRILADNTDVYGFEQSVLEAGGILSGHHAVVLGAGGASAAIVYALRHFQTVTLLNRTRARAEELAVRFPFVRVESWEKRSSLVAGGADLLVNTTSLGMAGQPPLDIELSETPPSLVVDIVYKPLMTDLLRQGRARGANIQHGLSMLVHQAVPSFLAYSGQAPRDASIMLRQLTEEFQ